MTRAAAGSAAGLSRSDRRVGWTLAVCAAVVTVWQVLAALSARPWAGFTLSPEAFASFHPAPPAWSVQQLPVGFDPIEPNILATEWNAARPAHPVEGRPILVRLVHGYNMCDCMRIKGYEVTALADTRAGADAALAAAGRGLPRGLQVWALTSPTRDRTVWVTSMLRAFDFTATDVDVRSMAFPRVGTPDALDWNPQGFRWSSLRHPLRNARLFLRAKWNASRCDVLTFLRLRQPAWASDEVLTLVSATRGHGVSAADTEAAIRHVVSAHMAMHAALTQHRHAMTLDSEP